MFYHLLYPLSDTFSAFNLFRYITFRAAYAVGRRTSPVPVELDNYARAKHIVATTLLHARETAEVEAGAAPIEFIPP